MAEPDAGKIDIRALLASPPAHAPVPTTGAGAFTAAGAALISDVLTALSQSASEIMLEADTLIPKDTETARESARIFPPDMDPSPGVTFGYGFGGAINPKTGNPVDEYVVPLHEILEAEHEPPTQAKYLEEPVFAYAGVMEGRLSAEVTFLWGRETPVAAFGGGRARRGLTGFVTNVPQVIRSTE